jgi:hypothetical protein
MFGADDLPPKSYCEEQYQFACASGECIVSYLFIARKFPTFLRLNTIDATAFPSVLTAAMN